MGLSTYPEIDVNKISKKLRDYLDGRALEPGQIAKYRLLNGVRNVDPQRKKGDDYRFPVATKVGISQRIIDPGSKNNPITIGVIRDIDKVTRMPKFAGFYAKPDPGSNGIFTISATVTEEIEFYELLELSNLNRSNPFRDTSVEPLFERVEEAKEAKGRMERRDYLSKCYDSIAKWTEKELKTMAAAYNISTRLDPGVLRDTLASIAEKEPKVFFESIGNDDLQIAALVRLSVENNIIAFNPVENKWTYVANGETAALLDRREGVDEFEGLKHFIKDSGNGAVVKGQLQKMLKAAVK